MFRVCALACVLLVAVSACAGGESSAEPPWGLDSIEMPDTEDKILSIFASFPDEIDGYDRWSHETASASYGEFGPGGETIDPYAFGFIKCGPMEQVIQLLDQADSDWTTLDWLSWVASPSSPSPPVEAMALEPGSGLVWVATREPVATDDIGDFLFHWAKPDGSWVFSLQATSETARRKLVEAFVEAAGG